VACTSATFCVVVGDHAVGKYQDSGLAEAWDGLTWRLQHTPAVAYGSSLAAISCAAANRCMAVGSYNANKIGVAEPLPLAERWNGRGWTAERPPPDRVSYRGKLASDITQLTGVSCPSRSFCLASGIALRAQNGDPFGAFAVRFDGTRWTTTITGLPFHSPFYGVSCLSSSDCLAIGQFDRSVFPPPATTQPLVENWNRTHWSRVALPHVPIPSTASGDTPDALDPVLLSISCVLHSGCTAVGAQAHGSADTTLAQADVATPGIAPG
jgi:hypothetical protein